LLALKDYEKQRKAGKDPVLIQKILVSNAHIWNTIGKIKRNSLFSLLKVSKTEFYSVLEAFIL
jgi:hypothetical protein